MSSASYQRQYKRVRGQQQYPHAKLRWALKHKYGLTADAYLDLLDRQHHKCAICGKPQTSIKRRLAVDHDHKTGKVRGLLCFRCNTALGAYEFIRPLAEAYLRKHALEQPTAQRGRH